MRVVKTKNNLIIQTQSEEWSEAESPPHIIIQPLMKSALVPTGGLIVAGFIHGSRLCLGIVIPS